MVTLITQKSELVFNKSTLASLLCLFLCILWAFLSDLRPFSAFLGSPDLPLKDCIVLPILNCQSMKALHWDISAHAVKWAQVFTKVHIFKSIIIIVSKFKTHVRRKHRKQFNLLIEFFHSYQLCQMKYTSFSLFCFKRSWDTLTKKNLPNYVLDLKNQPFIFIS